MIRDLHIDVLMMQEVGVNWSRVGADNQWKARAGGHLDPNHSRSFMSHNTRSIKSSPLQAGGTGIMSYGPLAHSSAGAGSDKKKLGRWTWTRFQGKQGSFLRCVSIYRPCPNNNGAETVYAQHRQYLQSINDDRDPRTAFLEDFEVELQEWLGKGDHVIVGGDINQDIRHPDIQELFSRNGMVNVIDERHDLSEAPATFMYGNNIIDGLWATPGITVRRCGYFAPGDHAPGDHSLVWMDATYDSALGHTPILPRTFQARRLRLYDSKTTQRYLDKYQQLIHQYRIIPRQCRLQQSIQYGHPLSTAQAQEADAIDNLRTKAMLHAEKKCRKLRMGGVAFSLATEQPRRQIIFWNLAIKRRKGGTVSSRLWRRKKQKANIQESTRELSIGDMISRLQAARQAYREAKRNHKAERESFLQQLSPKDRDRLLRVEKQRELGRAAKKVTGKLSSLAVSKVIHNGTEYSDRQDIENILLQVNESKIRSSEDTPFLQEPLLPIFGLRNDTAATEAVLDGCFQCPEGTPVETQDLIRHLKRSSVPAGVQRFHPRRIISTEDNTRSWQRAKERTAAGMSGLHFGMFKAHTLRPQLSALDASMRSIAYMTGFAYSRWKKGLDVQLLKKLKDFRAEKLRTILLLEADFNMNNKALGSDMMKLGERHQALTKDNYGGRKGHRASEVSLNSCLTYDSTRGRRGRLIVISNDARGCYDRIAHTVLQLAMLRLGVPRPALQSMIETIQEMDHYICTAFGVSANKYGADANRLPTQGILQGNGAGPAGWFAISSVLIDAMKDAGFGYSDWTLISRKAIQIATFAFVDDTDLLHMNNSPDVSTQEMLDEAQQMVSKWHGLLRASGGNLAPEKSYWYLVELHWKGGRWQYKEIDEAPGDLWLPGSMHPIERRPTHKCAEALGVLSRPDGKMCDEVKYLRERVHAWSDRVRTGHLQPEVAWYCMNATIMKTIEYPLCATTFSRQEVQQFMQPLLRVALNSFGIQKNMPRTLVYGTLRSRGMGIQDPFWTQLICHLQVILRQGLRNTPTRMLLDENMELVQLYVGSEINFWELPFEAYGFLAPQGWMKHTWEALSSTSLTLRGPQLMIPLRRQRDVYLMDAFVNMSYDSDTLQVLNECRLYLHAVMLSDISTADGTMIDRAAWLGMRPHSRRYIEQRWIKTCDPGPRYWTCWQQALRNTFLFLQSAHLRLRQPLGAWLSRRDSEWKWWIHPPSQRLYCHHEDGSWSRASGRRRLGQRMLYNTDSAICSDRVPVQLLRVTVLHPSGSPTISMSGVGNVLEDTPVVQESLTSKLRDLPPSSRWAVRHIQVPDNGVETANALRHGTAIAVSDGSLCTNLGTAAFIITNPTKKNSIVGTHLVPGMVRDGDSLRCELSGLYGIFTVVRTIVQHFHITQGAIHVACDNIQALAVLHPDFLPDPQQANFDLINAIWYMLRESPLQWTYEHVYGHQDSKCRHRPLTRLEVLNVHMDRLAKNTWSFYARQSESFDSNQHTCFQHEGWQIWSGSDKIVNPSTPNLYELLQDSLTQMWWVRHGIVRQDSLPEIDWEGTSDMMSSLTPGERKYVTKNASENCGVGSTLVRWKFQSDATCPRCGMHEDPIHVYRCTGNQASEVWQSNMLKLRSFLTASQTDPVVQDALVSSLSRWRQGEAIDLHSFAPSIIPVVRQQHDIGWKNMLEGLAGTQWRQAQQLYYDRHNIRKSSKRWLRGTLTRILRLGRGQWLHRNDEKHVRAKPRHRRALQLLQKAIIWLYVRRTSDLLPGDHGHMDINLSDLLQRSPSFRQSWYLNVVAARTRCLRIRYGNPAFEDPPPGDEDIQLWIRGRPR